MRCREWRPSPPADRSCAAVLLTWAVAEGARSLPIPDPSCHSDTGQTCACGRGEWSRPRPSDPPPPDRTGESQPTDITQTLFGPALRPINLYGPALNTEINASRSNTHFLDARH